MCSNGTWRGEQVSLVNGVWVDENFFLLTHFTLNALCGFSTFSTTFYHYFATILLFFSLSRLSTCVCTHIAWIYRGLFAAVASSRKLCIFLKSCMHNATMIYSDSAQWNLHIIFVHVKNFRVKEDLRTFGIKINFINE